MPLYDFACQSCEHTFEALVLNGEKVECPKCQGEEVERLLSLPGRPPSLSGADFPMACGDPSLPPCGAPGCMRTGRK